MSEIFFYEGLTGGTYIYTYRELGVLSRFYIQQWRVPEPIPSSVEVAVIPGPVFQQENTESIPAYIGTPPKRLEPIISKVYRVSWHTKTTRYDTRGPRTRPFNSIYIPNFLLEGAEDNESVQIVVKWIVDNAAMLGQR